MKAEEQKAVVIGAGVLGLSTALFLQRAGVPTAVIDALPPAGGASYGNAGMISPDSAIPVALPGMLPKVPGWLMDPLGPLAVAPAHFIKALPWFARWLDAGRMSRVIAISDAMRALHKETLDCWHELIGAQAMDEMVHKNGQIRLLDSAPENLPALQQELYRRHQIRTEALTVDDLRQMLPGLAPHVTHGLLLPDNAYTHNPARLVKLVGELFVAAGGEIRAERVLKILPGGARGDGGGRYTIMTNIDNHVAAYVVVAAGAWSKELLKPLGINVPLETERGYHVMLPDHGLDIRRTISVSSGGFGVTPMEHGLRIAGTVEFAGLARPPNEQRAYVLIEKARKIFPGLNTDRPRIWMGHRPSTPDSLPIVGEASGHPGLYLAFGNAHFGMTGGPPSGRMIANMITKRPQPVDPHPYRPGRF
jgi:D-amino-acid dehydrogenase